MPWDTLTTIQTNTNWQYSPLVTGKLFRLRHTTNSARPQDLRAVIGQAFSSENVEMFFNTHRIVYKPEVEIFEFIQPGEFLERSIAIKRLDNLLDSWSIEIEALNATFIPVDSINLSLEFNKATSLIMRAIL